MSHSSKAKNLAVVGLGYVGLPLATLAQEKGWTTTGIDINQEAVNVINAGKPPFHDDDLEKALSNFPITATTDPASVKTATHIIVAVPTPVTPANLPDLTPLKSALTSILPYLSAGQSLIIESTINPGVMDEIVLPILRERSDLTLDADTSSPTDALHVTHCPERINPGDEKWTVRNIPRVLGGYSQVGAKLAASFYESVLEAPIRIMDTATEAEAVKILENTFRDINIAYINEMARSFASLDIDITNVIAGAATKPFGFMPHYPGNGVGGHCISVDPYYMIARGKEVGFDHKFLKLARQINEDMPAYTVQLLAGALSQNNKSLSQSRIALLGIAYKKNVSDLRNSPALRIQKLLQAAGAAINIYDPLVPEQSNVKNLKDALQDCDAVMLACDHDSLVQELTPEFLKENKIHLILDGKNALNPKSFPSPQINYLGIGRSN